MKKIFNFDITILENSTIIHQGRAGVESESFDSAIEQVCAECEPMVPKRGNKAFIVFELAKIVVDVSSALIVPS